MKYVIGIDVGTSGMKSIVVNQKGNVVSSYSVSYQTEHPHTGYSEMDPNIWYEAAIESLKVLVTQYGVDQISGVSFSGQMHGLVIVDNQGQVIRPAILWNDTRTSQAVADIKEKIGLKTLLNETQNTVIEGFTLPKLIWLKLHEPAHYNEIYKFMLPKDYIVYRLTGNLYSEPSDAAGTIMFNVKEENWSTTILEKLDIDTTICPDIIPSHGFSGTLTQSIMEEIGYKGEETINVYQGGADNACGALGAGITDENKQLVSIGTSGVALSIINHKNYENDGKVHYFNHCVPNQKYIMGVTLSAGYSLEWIKQLFSNEEDFETFLRPISESKIGANGLIFTPYLLGERTPHNDAKIRGSFIGLDANTTRADIKRAVLEGVTFSIKDSIQIIRGEGKAVQKIVSIGGGAKNPHWLQIQADVFNAQITTRTEEQGPAFGAAMLAAMGEQWFDSFSDMSEMWINYNASINSDDHNVGLYQSYYEIYQDVYRSTRALSDKLVQFK